MSRIGNSPITIPQEVTVNIKPPLVEVKGPKGTLQHRHHHLVSISQQEGLLTVSRKKQTKLAKSVHGTTQRIISNMVVGVTQGYQKTLELIGTGYRVTKQGNKLSLTLGFSHPVEFQPPESVNINVEGNNIIHIQGSDKQVVGQIAATIRNFRPPEPYKGKGIRYQGERIRRKAGKAAKAAA